MDGVVVRLVELVVLSVVDCVVERVDEGLAGFIVVVDFAVGLIVLVTVDMVVLSGNGSAVVVVAGVVVVKVEDVV